MSWDWVWKWLKLGGYEYPTEFRKWVEAHYDIAKSTINDIPDLAKAIALDAHEQYIDPGPGKRVTGQYYLTDTPNGPAYRQYQGQKAVAVQWDEKGKPVKFETQEDWGTPVLVKQSDEQWQASQWVFQAPDGSQYTAPAPKNPTDVKIGVIDKNGVPQALDSAFLPQDEKGLTPYQQWEIQRATANDALDQQNALADQTLAIQKQLDKQNLARQTAWQREQQSLVNQSPAVQTWFAGNNQFEQQYQASLKAYQDAIAGVGTGPSDWISIWNAKNLTPPQQPWRPRPSTKEAGAFANPGGQPDTASSWADAARQGLSSWYKPGDLQLAQQAAGIDLNRQPVYDPLTNSYRPETDQEYTYRTVTTVMNNAYGTAPQQWIGYGSMSPSINDWAIQWAKDHAPPVDPSSDPNFWNLPPEEQQNLTDAYNKQFGGWQNNFNAATQDQVETNPAIYDSTKPVGPKLPDYLKGVVGTVGAGDPTGYYKNLKAAGWWNPANTYQNPDAGQVNLGTLGQFGNALRPVSAQMWQGWSPSQRAGYGGLVNATGVWQGPKRIGSENFNDWMNNEQTMWGASRTGQMATRRY